MKFIHLIIVVLFVTFDINAQDIEVVNVRGSFIEQPDKPQIIITANDLQAFSANGFVDVLRGLPGIDVSQQGGSGGLTFLSIRGGDPNFVIVIIDGVKVNDPTNSRGGAFDLGIIDVSIIDKVEIYYGSFSTVYGSDALSGILKISTKRSSEHGSALISTKAGNLGVTGASAHINVPLTDIANISFSGATQDNDISSFGDDFSRTEFISSIESTDNRISQWRISGFYAKGKAQYFPEDSGGDRLAVIREPESRYYTQRNIAAKILFPMAEQFNIQFDADSTMRDEDLKSPGIADGILSSVPAIVSKTNFHRKAVNTAFNYHLSADVNGVLGLSKTEELGSMRSVIDFGMFVDADYNLHRETISIFSEVNYKLNESASIIAGIRRDKTKQLKVTTKRLLVKANIYPTSNISVHYSEGFKLPSFFALGHPLVGNSELKPEKSRNVDVSLASRYLDNSISTRVSIFQSHYTDLVDFDPELFTNVNRSKVTVKGAEVFASFIPNDMFKLTGQISHTYITTYNENVNLRRRPKFKGSIKGSYQLTSQLEFDLRYVINSSYFDSSVPTGIITLDGINQIDASARWRSQYNIDWRLQINNLLDSKKEETIGFERLGLNIVLNVAMQF